MRQLQTIGTKLAVSVGVAALLAAPQQALAQQAGAQSADTERTAEGGAPAGQVEGNNPRTTAEALTDEIIVTGRKFGRGEALQDVPLAVTAFGEAQLEAAKVRDLQDLSYSVPNVSLDPPGTVAGAQNFMIRGLGINSSIPSTDPAVGVFIDGVYMGSIWGVLLDVFDLEGIEVLRGPQGVAFGRNVTGGAILLRTKAPSNEFEAKVRASLETGPEYSLAGAINVPIGDMDAAAARITGYYRNDKGYFKSSVSDDFGEAETFFIRPALRFAAGPGEIILRYEHGEITGDGAVFQNDTFFDDFDVGSGDEGETDLRWDQFTAEANIDVALGNGTITNIFGWRDVGQFTRIDIDGRPAIQFHTGAAFDQDQISNELRYTGTPMRGVRLTVGGFYFEQSMIYFEQRILAGGAIVSTLGGTQEHWTGGLFTAADVDLTDELTLNLGLRYSKEHKSVQVATFNALNSACNFQTRTCNYDFGDSHSWGSLLPRVGLQWQPNDNLQLYGYWTRGVRSGGYNFRSVNPNVAPGPTEEETQDAVEIGLKSDWLDRRLRTNVAVFYNKLQDLQRDINLPNPVAGNAQVIRNTADARILGGEIEVVARPFPNFVVSGSLGYIDANYTKVVFDINNDGRIDQADLDLKLTRVAPWTYGIGATYEIMLGGSGSLAIRGVYSHRDRAAFSDPNTTFLPKTDLVDASLTYKTRDARFSLSAFGKNLTNERVWDASTLTPFGVFNPIGKGRRYGLEANLRF